MYVHNAMHCFLHRLHVDIHGASLPVVLLLIIEYSAKDLKTLKALQLVGKVFLDKASRIIYQDPLDWQWQGRPLGSVLLRAIDRAKLAAVLLGSVISRERTREDADASPLAPTFDASMRFSNNMAFACPGQLPLQSLDLKNNPQHSPDTIFWDVLHARSDTVVPYSTFLSKGQECCMDPGPQDVGFYRTLNRILLLYSPYSLCEL